MKKFISILMVLAMILGISETGLNSMHLFADTNYLKIEDEPNSEYFCKLNFLNDSDYFAAVNRLCGKWEGSMFYRLRDFEPLKEYKIVMDVNLVDGKVFDKDFSSTQKRPDDYIKFMGNAVVTDLETGESVECVQQFDYMFRKNQVYGMISGGGSASVSGYSLIEGMSPLRMNIKPAQEKFEKLGNYATFAKTFTHKIPAGVRVHTENLSTIPEGKGLEGEWTGTVQMKTRPRTASDAIKPYTLFNTCPIKFRLVEQEHYENPYTKVKGISYVLRGTYDTGGVDLNIPEGKPVEGILYYVPSRSKFYFKNDSYDSFTLTEEDLYSGFYLPAFEGYVSSDMNFFEGYVTMGTEKITHYLIDRNGGRVISMKRTSSGLDSEKSNNSGSLESNNTQLFSDLPADNWANEYVKIMKDKGLITGYPDGTFKPNATLNRGAFAKVLCEAYGLDPYEGDEIIYSDVQPKDWFYPYVMAVQKKNAITYYGNVSQNLFKPNEPMRREDVAIALVNFLGLDHNNCTVALVKHYKDKESLTSHETAKYVALAYEYNIMRGDENGNFRPNDPLTRAQACKVFVVALEELAKLQE